MKLLCDEMNLNADTGLKLKQSFVSDWGFEKTWQVLSGQLRRLLF